MPLPRVVILGHLVPTGTGFRDYLKTRVQKNVDLHAAAEEIGRTRRPSTVDVGGPVIRLEGLEEGDEIVTGSYRAISKDLVNGAPVTISKEPLKDAADKGAKSE